MVSHVHTVAFYGIDVINVTVQVQIAAGLPSFTIVGLPDKAVAESRERIRSSFHTIGLALPPKRITVNLAPADVQKEGSHYDLPVALGLMAALSVIRDDDIAAFTVLGELGLDGSLAPVSGILPAAMDAVSKNRGLICPAQCGSEAAWAGDLTILAAPSLLAIMNHFKGTQVLTPPKAEIKTDLHGSYRAPDLHDIKGQEVAKRALEIAASGGHNLLLVGPPGAGKSMLAARMPSILPDLEPREALEVTMLHSIGGNLPPGGLMTKRPFRDPHHSASLPALVGGGMKCKPGEISLAHKGVLFLDELPEFSRPVLESLRQPWETGQVTIARANMHVSYPARFQVIAAMNPCRCGYFGDPDRQCNRAPKCATDYQNKLSGPIIDRFDLMIDVEEVRAQDLLQDRPRETSAQMAKRVAKTRQIQAERYKKIAPEQISYLNCMADGDVLYAIAQPTPDGQSLLTQALEKFKISGRGYHRILRVARTLADMEAIPKVQKHHIAEALGYRRFL